MTEQKRPEVEWNLMFRSPSEIGSIMRIIHEATEFSRPRIGSPMSSITPIDRIPDLDLASVEIRSKEAAQLLEQVDALDLDAVPKEIGLTLRLIRHDLQRVAGDADRYWLVVDTLGIGYYGMFAWSAYGGGFLLNLVASYARAFRFEIASDADRYLAVVSDVARLINQLDTRTQGQAERGIYMPQAQLAQATPLIENLRTMLVAGLKVAPERISNLTVPTFLPELERRLNTLVAPALSNALITLGGDYQRHASDGVGLAQFPGGAAVYDDLVRFHTTLDLTPLQVHELGLERMKSTRVAMAEVRDQAGFDGDDQEYLQSLRDDPLWRADSVEGVAAMFQRYIDRLKPLYDEYFDIECSVPYGVGPLPESLEAGMTFGFYDMPRSDKQRGDYLFNGANLMSTQLSNIAALTYHELVPGHHLHISTQQANDVLHPLHNNAFFNAFNEGWAEYAATLAGEAGMYADPAERFGRLIMESFLTCRLVVDTGMNSLGWTLEEARAYMRENAFMSETEIDSETVRYSCDIPAQSLAYKIGDSEIRRMREDMRAQLGAGFDIRAFHSAVLKFGGMPFPLLEWNVRHTLAVE